MHSSLLRFFSLNSEWAKRVESQEPTFFEESAKGQSPQVLWIGCSDSRVPESVITAVRPGEIFVHRNIANQIHLDDTSVQAVLAYAIDHVGVEHVVVVGHTQCGGAAASFDAACSHRFSATDDTCIVIPGTTHESPLNQWLTPLTKLAASLKLSGVSQAEALPVVVDENVKQQVENLAQFEPITNAWAHKSKAGKDVWIHGWVYDLAKGELRDLDISRGPK